MAEVSNGALAVEGQPTKPPGLHGLGLENARLTVWRPELLQGPFPRTIGVGENYAFPLSIAEIGNTIPTVGNTIPNVGNIMPTIGNIMPTIGNIMPTIGNIMPTIGNTMPTIGNTMPTVGNTLPIIGNTLPIIGHNPQINWGQGMQIVTSTTANPIVPNSSTSPALRLLDSTYCLENDEHRINQLSNLSYTNPALIPRSNINLGGDPNLYLVNEYLRRIQLIEQQSGMAAINGATNVGTNARTNPEMTSENYLELQRLRDFVTALGFCPIGGACPVGSTHKIPAVAGKLPAFGAVPQQSMDIANHIQLYHSNTPPHHPNIPLATHVEAQPHGETTLVGYHFPPHLREGKHSNRRSIPIEAAYRSLSNEHIYPDEDPPSSHVTGKGRYNPLYKTELCRNWTEIGNCRYGRTCQFAHGRAELRPASRNNQQKTKICVAWLNGSCAFGSKCCYSHRVPAEDPDLEFRRRPTEPGNDNGNE